MLKRILLALCFLGASSASESEAQSLRGSRASVDLMYRQAQSHGLHFYETPEGVRKAASRGTFVRLRNTASYQIASVSHPYVLPTTRTFLDRLGAQYKAACGEKLVVTSAVRPKSQRLSNSVEKSVHPTGMAIDLRRPSNGRCLAWLRRTLSQLDSRGVIEATEERRPPHFHVAVFPRPYQRYVGGGGGGGEVKLAADHSEDPPRERGRRYKVRRGDTLWTIARRNGISVERLRSTNELRSTRIVAGQVLVIPGRD